MDWILDYRPFVHTTRNYTVQITDTQTSVLSLLQLLLAVSWQRLLQREGDSSASRAQVLLSQPPVQNSCQLITHVTGSQAGDHFAPTSCSLHRLTSIWQLTTELSHSATSHFTALHSIDLLTAEYFGVRVRVRVTLWLAAQRQSVRLGDKPPETHDQ
jgi:hypothetical protein